MPFFFSGSDSSQFKSNEVGNNPLPPCPDSPNCVRISRGFNFPKGRLWEAVNEVIELMNPSELEKDKTNLKLAAVFRVLLFKDDMTIQIEERDGHSLLHLRNASREGYSDLGVNRRRVKRFLRLLQKKL